MDGTTFRLDRGTRGLMTILTILLAVIAVELWVVSPPSSSTANAQVPDTGMQRKQIVDEARRTNELLEQILDHLKNGSVKVKTDSADKRKGKPAEPARR